MRIGHHTSIAGSLERAALKAVEIGANTFQIFSSSPRQWRASPLSKPQISLFLKAREKYDLAPLVIHDNYLINLAAAEGETRKLSIPAFRGELERAIELEADYLVAHPGNYRGQSLEQGMFNVIQALAESSAGLRCGKLMLLLENTAGAGGQLGSRFEELQVLREYLMKVTELKVGYCIDTCHTLVSGHDIASAEGFPKTIAEIDGILGWDNVPVIHANDSKAGIGSHVDRHANIGEGYIGRDGFRRILTHPKLRNKAFILETPVDQPGDDQRNVEALKELAGPGASKKLSRAK